jgi:penicillin-binding protein 1A
MAKRLGIKTELERTYTKGGPSVAPLSLALGTSEVTPLELLNAYAVFPSGGYLADPYFIREFTTPTGQRSVKEPPQAEKVLEPPLVYLMTSLMQDVVQNGTAIRAKKVKFGTGKGQSVAGKTGTTQSATDAWFVGFSPDIAAVVWVGNNDSTPLGSYWEGSRAALPIWIEVMKAALQNHGPADFGPPPPGVVQVNGEYYLEGKVPPPPTPDGGIDPNAPDGGTPTTPVAEAAAQNSPDAGNQPPEPEIAPAVTSEPINQ